jgi:hypothetical protein
MKNITAHQAREFVKWIEKKYHVRILGVSSKKPPFNWLLRIKGLNLKKFSGFVLDNKIIIKDYQSKSPFGIVRLILHELDHISQIRQIGTRRWYFLYAMRKSLRIGWEIRAYHRDIECFHLNRSKDNCNKISCHTGLAKKLGGYKASKKQIQKAEKIYELFHRKLVKNKILNISKSVWEDFLKYQKYNV